MREISTPEKGKNIVAKAYPVMMSRYEFFVNSISRKELDIITPILDKLYAAIKNQHQEELGR